MSSFKFSFLIFILCFSNYDVFANYDKAISFFNKKQYKESILEFKKVIENSNFSKKKSDAMFNLGVIYDNGFGVKKNKSKAFDYYKLAAEKKHKIAQYNLAWMYYNGESIEKNFFEAFKFYNLSAEQGYNKAQYNLASLFYYGDGTIKDYVQAFKWYKISSMNGIKESDSFLKKLQIKMHPDEIKESEKIVENWLENQERQKN